MVPVKMGLVVKNINTPDVGLENKDIVPMEARLGIAFGFAKITPALDIGYRDNDVNVYVGAESALVGDTLVARLGGNKNEIDAGMGYKFNIRTVGLGVDYAFRWPLQLEGSSGSHRISLSMVFGSNK